MTNHHLPSQLITRGKDFRDVLLENIRQARREILIETHQLAFDDVGQALLSELEYACQRGLRVRCLIDAQGCAGLLRDHPALLNRLETGFRMHRPPLPGSPRPSPRDRRNIMLFDRRLAVLGGRELCRESLEACNLDVLYGGPEIQEVVGTWHWLWRRGAAPDRRRASPAWPIAPAFSRPAQVLTNTGLRRRRWHYRQLRAMLAAAHQRIWLAAASPLVIDAVAPLLRDKARQGLDIRLLLPPGACTIETRDQLLRDGCRLHMYTVAPLRAHALLTDTMALVGTSRHGVIPGARDFLIDLCCREPDLVAQLTRWFRERMEESSDIRDGAMTPSKDG